MHSLARLMQRTHGSRSKTRRCQGSKKFVKAPLAHEDLMDIIFHEGLFTNEHAEVPGVTRQHALAGSDGSSDPEPEATFEPTSLSRKRSGEVAAPTSGPESKKTWSSTVDECLIRIANAYEQSMSQVRAAVSGDNVDTDRMEVHRLMQVVVTDGFLEGTDEHFYAAGMLMDKRFRDIFMGFRTAEGCAGYLRRMWPIF